MSEKPTRRRLLALVGAGVTGGLAGCSGGDDAGGGTETATPTNTPEATDTPTPTDTQTSMQSPTPTTTSTAGSPDDGEPVGEVVENAVEELEITDWSARTDDDAFVITLSIENTGDQQTQLVEYWYAIMVYDAEGTKIPRDSITQTTSEKTNPGPGEVGVVDVVVNLENDNPEDVARYEITINCTLAEEAAYCEG